MPHCMLPRQTDAIPKYQKALEKAHSAEVVNVLRNMANAETIYYLANEKYTDDLSELDIKFPYDYSIVANISGRKYFYGGKFTYAFWYDKKGLWSYKEYKDGLYML